MVSNRSTPDGPPVQLSGFATQGDDLQAFVRDGVSSVTSLVESTYGPRGMDALVQFVGERNDIEVVVTDSGSRLLDAIDRGNGFNHPVAAILVDAVDTMHRDLSDGTTGALLLGGALLEQGYELIEQGLTPSDVVVGYALAAERVGEVLDELARPVSAADTYRLETVARTALSGRLDQARQAEYASMIVEAVTGLSAHGDERWVDTEYIKIMCDARAETALHNGVVTARWPRGAETSERSLVEFDWSLSLPTPIEDVTVAVLDSEIDIEETGANFGSGSKSGVILADAQALETYTAGYEAHLQQLVDHVRELGIDVIVSQPELDDDIRQLFEADGVVVIDKVETPEVDIERLATASGATVVSRVEALSPDRLGTVGAAYEQRMSEAKWTYFTGCQGGAYTLVLRTPTERNDEYRTGLVEDAVDIVATALIDGQILPGAGAPNVTAATDLRRYASGVEGREQLAVRAFANAIETPVRALAGNAGLDATKVLTDLRACRADDVPDVRTEPSMATSEGAAMGIDVRTGDLVDTWEAGIVEPRRVFSQALETGRTVANRLLTTDACLHPNVDLGDFAPTTEHD